MRRLLCWIAGVLLIPGLPGGAQAVPADGALIARAQQPEAIALGRSARDLFGPWKFHVGDDPAWAGAGFDDTHWESVDFHVAGDPSDPDPGTSSLAPGWTSQGHPGYYGYAWYRLRLNVQGTGEQLAIKMPDAFDDAYQVFVNGQQVGQFGHFGTRREWAYPSQPRGFPLPAHVRNGPVTIAIRMWMGSASRFSGPDAGGLHGPPMLGSAATIGNQVELDWDSINRELGSGFLETLVLLLALCVAAAHYSLDRSDPAYLWLSLVSLVTLLGNLILQVGNYTMILSSTVVLLSRDVLLTPLRIGIWILFFASWFGLRLSRRLLWPTGVLVGLLAIGTLMLRPPLHGLIVPLSFAAVLTPALLWIKLALAGLLFWVSYKGIREERAEGWLALPAILLAVAANYQHELRLAHVRVQYAVLGYNVSLGQLSTMLSLLLVTLLGSRRFLMSQRQKLQYRLEVEQASELQRVIIPSEMPQVPGLRIDSEYRPSRDVGGDFFQIIPDSSDGSVLIVVGDVTGKGLRAGMLVALIVGIVDTAVKEEPTPDRVISAINESLCGRGYATATCIAVKIRSDGLLVATNAGHLPPYINGRTLEMEGALPLGTLSGLSYETVEYRLQKGDVITLITDGVIEAQDEHGELFGFDRVCDMVSAHATANAIASAAQSFGQEDDILVLRIECTVSY
ncbi:SpoIIE family protein phosphatase [Terriglobus sp.]|uniref:PP2C family protein-serine/threonine phosphatase n=1 Tax=Terriglobus sp. TaxID=1889013 RepID=UPI003B0035F0